MTWIKTILCISITTICIKYSLGFEQGNSTSDSLDRHKRTLIFNINGGVAKLVMGVLVPVTLTGKRSLNWAVNLQAQYLTLDMPPGSYNPWNIQRSMSGNRTNRAAGSDAGEVDYSREYIYGLIEMVMNRYDKNGRVCLQRAICEVSQHPFRSGLFGQVADAILIPPRGSSCSDDVYYAAHLAGVAGVDCLHHFPDCPRKDGILERISFLM